MSIIDSPQQVKDLGINWAVLGHSERRQYYNDTDEVIMQTNSY